MGKEENAKQESVAGTMPFVGADGHREDKEHYQNHIDDLFSLSYTMIYLFDPLELPWVSLLLNGSVSNKQLYTLKHNKERYYVNILIQ